MSTRTRWLLVIPSAFVGIAVAFLFLWVSLVGLEWLCPAANRTSVITDGMAAPVFDCSASWYAPIRTATFFTSLAVAPILAVLLPALVAPKNKLSVAAIFSVVVLGYILLGYKWP